MRFAATVFLTAAVTVGPALARPVVNAVVNGASFDAGIAPGSLRGIGQLGMSGS